MAKKTSNLTPEIKYTSTKSDIWKAYKQALAQSAQHQTNPKEITQTSQQIGKINLTFKQQLHQASQGLGTQLDDFINQVCNNLEQAQKVLTQLAEQRVAQEEHMAAEKEVQLQQRKREAEEYNYEFNIRKRHQEDELADIKDKTLMELDQQKAELKSQHDELKELRESVATFDHTMTAAVKEAVEANTKQLESQFTQQRVLLEQQAAANQKLAEQRIKSLEDLAKLQEQELKRLQNTQAQTQNQLSQIAQKAVMRQAATESSTQKQQSQD